MEPIDFTPEQLETLPPHIHDVLAKNQPQYRPLPFVQIDGPEGRVISRWTLTDEERKRIADGEDLYLEQLTFNPGLTDPCARFQPILPTVGLRTQTAEAPTEEV